MSEQRDSGLDGAGREEVGNRDRQTDRQTTWYLPTAHTENHCEVVQHCSGLPARGGTTEFSRFPCWFQDQRTSTTPRSAGRIWSCWLPLQQKAICLLNIPGSTTMLTGSLNSVCVCGGGSRRPGWIDGSLRVTKTITGLCRTG